MLAGCSRPLAALPASLVLVSLAGSAVAAPLSGSVLDGTTLEPIAGATVAVEETDVVVTTDAAGGYDIADVPEGEVTLRVSAPGYEETTEIVGVPTDGLRGLVIALLPPGATGETIVVVERPPIVKSTPGQTDLTREEIQKLPGTRGDAVSSVKSLPGVANADAVGAGPGLLVIRGAAPEDSLYLLDGIQIPLVYHFFGLQSILPSEFIDDIEFVPGGFGPEYGRATGGIIHIRTRPSRAERLTGFAEMSFINLAGYLEGPLWEEQNVSFAAAFRRSLIDFVLPVAIPDDVDLSFTTAPTYYDAQLRVDWLPDSHNRVTVMGLGSFDLLALVSEEENPNDPVASGTFENETGFSRALATWRHDRGDLTSTAVAAAGVGKFHVSINEDRFLRGHGQFLAVREQLEWRALDRLTLRAGGDLQRQYSEIEVRLPLPPQEGQPDDGNLTADPLIMRDDVFTDVRAAAWIGADVKPTAAVRVSPGLRLDYYGHIDEATVSPRLTTSYQVAPAWTLRGALGAYSRPLEQAESVPTFLEPELAFQYVAGVDWDNGEGLGVSASGFYTDRRNLIVQDRSLIEDDQLQAYVNRGTGRSYGMEALVRARADDFFGWIAYTLSRSDRVDGPETDRRLFDYDQTHNFIAVGSYRRGSWEFGARWQYSTGTPDTPVTGSVYLSDLNVWIPQFGEVNSTRLEAAHQLDVRVDKHWSFDDWKLSVFLDVTNVYAHAQTLGYQYNFDYSEREAFETIPIFPALGVRGSF